MMVRLVFLLLLLESSSYSIPGMPASSFLGSMCVAEAAPFVKGSVGGGDGQVRHVVRVLTFGDSLTAGWTLNAREFHPYSEIINEVWKPQGSIAVDHVGVSGETAVELAKGVNDIGRKYTCAAGRTWKSLSAVIHDAEQRSQPYTYVVIMAGTNDLRSTPPETIFEALKELHTACWHRGLRTLALTIPGLAAEQTRRYRHISVTRASVNDALRDMVSKNRDRTALVNLDDYVPFSRESEMWDVDGLHMTKRGYEEVARAVVVTLRQLIGE